MRFAHAVALCLFAMLGASGCGKSNVLAPVTIWHDLPTGEAIARRDRVPAVLFYWARWSTEDVELERKTFPDPAVRRAMDGLVAIKIDATDDVPPEAARFGMVGDPVILFVDDFDAYPRRFDRPRAEELLRVERFIGAAELAELLARARARAARR